MARLFFRDGTEYAGTCAINLRNGEAKLLVPGASGRIRWAKLYTAERLGQLQRRSRDLHRKSLSQMAVAYEKRSYREFVQEQDRLIEDIQRLAYKDEILQGFLDRMNEGQALSLLEINNAARIVKNLRKLEK